MQRSAGSANAQVRASGCRWCHGDRPNSRTVAEALLVSPDALIVWFEDSDVKDRLRRSVAGRKRPSACSRTGGGIFREETLPIRTVGVRTVRGSGAAQQTAAGASPRGCPGGRKRTRGGFGTSAELAHQALSWNSWRSTGRKGECGPVHRFRRVRTHAHSEVETSALRRRP